MTPTKTDAIAGKIRQFITEAYVFRETASDFSDTESLFDAGIVDSFGILNLITFLEETFDLQVKDDEVIPENFNSVAAMASFVDGKLSQ